MKKTNQRKIQSKILQQSVSGLNDMIKSNIRLKNWKKSLLLLALIVNLMPYINDGEMKWTTTEAQAQYYTIEEFYYNFILTYICRDHSNENTLFISFIKCEKIPYDDEEDDEEEDDNGGECEFPTTDQPVVDGIAINYGFSITTTDSPSDKWCAFCVLYAIKPIKTSSQDAGASQSFGGSTDNHNTGAWIYAKKYFTTVRVPRITDEYEMLSHGMTDTYFASFYGDNGVSCGAGISSKEEIISKMNSEKGIVFVPSSNDHVLLLYKVKKGAGELVGDAMLSFYDPLGEQGDRTINQFIYTNYSDSYVVSK